MRALLLLCMLLLAGCVAPVPGATTETPGPRFLPSSGTPFTAILCEGETLLPLDAPREGACNVKVTDAGPAAEVHLVASPLDPMLLVGGAKDFRLGEEPRCGKFSVWSGTFRSADGGRTWTTGLLPGYPGDARRTALSDYACGSDPVLAFAPDGTLYYSSLQFSLRPGEDPLVPQLAPFLGYATEGSAVAVTRSRDGGLTWDDPVIVQSAKGGLLDKQWIAVDPVTGDVHVSYFNNDGEIALQSSRDGGATWSAPLVLVEARDLPEGPPRQGQFAQVATTLDGRIHFIAWVAGDTPSPSALVHRFSTDRGASWSEPVQVAAWAPVIDPGALHPYRFVTLPAIAAHPSKPIVHVAYPAAAQVGAAPAARADLDVFVVTTRDGGKTWSAPVRVNDDANGAPNLQWMPAPAVGPDGTLHLTWLDYREDPQGRLARVWYARSADEGATFTRNVPVGDALFDGEGGYHQSGSGTIGDYMGLAVTSLAAHPFWADTREGRNDVYAAILPAS